MKKIPISSEYITLGQLLKFADVIPSGGETKNFLAYNRVLVNHEDENRRGRKLYPGDVIDIDPQYHFLISRKDEN